jgi:HD-like signal output (HDOD) protein
MRALVQHSLATAAAAESLARIGHAALAGDAFIAGLLHNLGTTVQIQLDSPGVQAIVTLRQAADVRDLRVLEDERVAVGHEDCAAIIFESWQLPAALIAAARHHHDPMTALEEHRPLAALVNLGANLGLEVGHTHTLEPQAGLRLVPAMDCLGLSSENLDSVAAALPERVAELRQAILG